MPFSADKKDLIFAMVAIFDFYNPTQYFIGFHENFFLEPIKGLLEDIRQVDLIFFFTLCSKVLAIIRSQYYKL